MPVRTQHRPLWQRVCRLSVISAFVSRPYPQNVMLRSFFLSAVTMTVTLSLDAPLPFPLRHACGGLRPRWRLPLSDFSKNVSSLSVIPENEPPSSCFRERNILCRQSKAVFLLMCNAAEILSRDFCSDIRCIYALTSPFLWSFCCHVPVYSVKVLPQSLHLKRCVPWSLPKR